VQRPQQPRATVEAQLKAQPEPHSEPEPEKPEQQSKPEPQKPEPQSMIEPQSGPEPGNPKPGEPVELRVKTTDAEPDHWKPGGFEPRAFDPGGSTEMTVIKRAHHPCSPLRVRLRLRGDG
jgi:hypothetical protein